MIYPILLIFGFIGLFVMAAMGSFRVGARHAPKSGAKVGKASLQPARGALRSARGKAMGFLSGISVIDLFAMCMGAGAMGIVGRKFLKLPEFTVVMMALAGAVAIDLLVVKPLFNMMMRFASTPSEGLEGMISQVAEAATSFDPQGRGLIRLTLDGQTSQVLATLDAGEIASGVKVHKGDRLIVIEVDPQKNVCRVSREIASEA